MIVEDSDADAYLIERALSRHPAVGRIVRARDGLEAREMVECGAVQPDLAFIDLQMPRKGGLELLVDLACRAQPGFPMVVLTSSTLAADRIRSRIRGAAGVITKPDTVDQLEALLAVVVDACGAASGHPRTTRALSREVATLRAAQIQSDEQVRSSLRTSAALRSAARIAQVGGWEMDFASEVTVFSPELCELLGPSFVAEMPISESLLVWVAADRPAFVQALDRVIAYGEFLAFEGRSPAADGGVKWWRLLGEPDFIEDRCVSLRGAAQDITKWRASEQRERAAALAADAMLSFLSVMSHEIRTPLNGVLGMAQIMGNGDLSDLQRQRLEVVAASGESLRGLFDDLLDLSRLAAGELQLEGGYIDPQILADAAQMAFGAAAKGRDLQFNLSLAPSALGLWAGDPRRLGQVMGKLVSNAVKFTDSGSVSVEIARTGYDLIIMVRDTGIGIAPERLPHIFERFVQADGSVTRRHGGIGMGLTICRDLLALMGGRIAVESRQDEGTTVTVTLPVMQAIAQEAMAMTARAPRTVQSPDCLHVLVAEDNPINQLVIKNLLSAVGIHPVIVENGRDAVDAWRNGDWNIILMDIQMPVMDGISATNLIRQEERETGGRRTPIVAVTANATPRHVAQYLAADMDGCVAKPIGLTSLLATMEAALDEAAKAPQNQQRLESTGGLPAVTTESTEEFAHRMNVGRLTASLEVETDDDRRRLLQSLLAHERPAQWKPSHGNGGES